MKGSKRACPSHVVALYDFDPFHDEVECDYAQESPDVNKQLSFYRNEILVVKSAVLDYWILCSSSRTGKEGYVCTSYVAPLSEQGELRLIKCGSRNWRKRLETFDVHVLRFPKNSFVSQEFSFLSLSGR